MTVAGKVTNEDYDVHSNQSWPYRSLLKT